MAKKIENINEAPVKVRKVGSGRTKGAVSIVTVPMGELLKVFASQKKTPIHVSRKWIEQFGIPFNYLPGQNPAEAVATPVATVTVKPDKTDAPKIKTTEF